jgi:hypothetical protein
VFVFSLVGLVAGGNAGLNDNAHQWRTEIPKLIGERLPGETLRALQSLGTQGLYQGDRGRRVVWLQFDSLDALENQLVEALHAFENDNERVKSICNWEWIIKSLSIAN